MKKTVIVIIALIVLCTCKYSRQLNRDLNYTAISVDPEKAMENIKMSEIFETVEYIALESPDEHLIGEIDQLLIYKERLYILDQRHTQSVFCFTKEGKFLYELNKKGQGPGEYTNIDNISIDHDSEHLLIFFNQKILEYDLEGKYIKTHFVDLWANDFAYIRDNCIAFFGEYASNNKYEKDNKTPNLLITKDYQVRYTDVFFPSQRNFSALTSNINHFSSDCNGQLSFLEAYNDTVYYLLPDTIKNAYYIDFGRMKKNERFYSLLYSPSTTLNELQSYTLSHNICNIIAFSETESCLFFIYYHQRIYHLAFYNKKTGQLTDVCRKYTNENEPVFPIQNDLNGGPFMPPYYTDGKSFYSSTDAYMLSEAREKVTDPDLKKTFDNISEYDNPVIIVMTPKN
jgi:hypothetical protein